MRVGLPCRNSFFFPRMAAWGLCLGNRRPGRVAEVGIGDRHLRGEGQGQSLANGSRLPTGVFVEVQAYCDPAFQRRREVMKAGE